MAQATDRPVILAVDDSTDLLALMAKALAAEYRVLTASDAGTALEMAAGGPRPDLILLDVGMPGAAGFALCRVRPHTPPPNQRHELERLVGERTAQLENTRLQLIRRLARAMELHESTAVGNRVMRLGPDATLPAPAGGA